MKNMRMRRKSNLDERMENLGRYLLVREPLDFYKKSEIDKFDVVNLSEYFGNENPIWLEIGCGKGKFAFDTAKLNSQINLIAVEKMSNVIIEPCERAETEKPNNLAFMNCGAENLLYYLPNGSVDRIYLNFSCPYPKYTYRNRRLTYYRYLDIYKKLLSNGGEIYLKTDNQAFFEFSLQSLSENSFKLKNVSLDLHNSDFTGNVTTEYEDLFVAQGKRIYRLEAYL